MTVFMREKLPHALAETTLSEQIASDDYHKLRLHIAGLPALAGEQLHQPLTMASYLAICLKFAQRLESHEVWLQYQLPDRILDMGHCVDHLQAALAGGPAHPDWQAAAASLTGRMSPANRAAFEQGQLSAADLMLAQPDLFVPQPRLLRPAD